LAKLVVEIFPTETTGTWYTVSQKSSPPNGKLYSKYNNYKTQLDQVGISQRTKRTAENVESVQLLQVNVETEYLDPMEIVKHQDFDDLGQFTDCWMLTIDERQSILKSQGLKYYFEAFPYLKSDSGYEMVSKTEKFITIFISYTFYKLNS
jgi:hypothetical protein